MTAAWRLLTFRLDSAGYQRLSAREAWLGLVLAGLAGIGRYWDHPFAGPLQRSGLGSVAYVLALAGLVWLLLRPFPGHRRPYEQVVAAVGLTAPPAWIYALPVERWVDVETAVELNVGFLAVVAVWRVALHGRFLAVGARCSFLAACTLLLLPLCGIVVALAALNLESAVFQIMAGIDRSAPEQRIVDGPYAVVSIAAFLAPLLFVPLLIAYGILVGTVRWRRPR